MAKSQTAWVCVIESQYTFVDTAIELGLSSLFPMCWKNPHLYDLDEQDYVDEYNQEHRLCGWFSLTRLDPQPTVEDLMPKQVDTPPRLP